MCYHSMQILIRKLGINELNMAENDKDLGNLESKYSNPRINRYAIILYRDLLKIKQILQVHTNKAM